MVEENSKYCKVANCKSRQRKVLKKLSCVSHFLQILSYWIVSHHNLTQTRSYPIVLLM